MNGIELRRARREDERTRCLATLVLAGSTLGRQMRGVEEHGGGGAVRARANESLQESRDRVERLQGERATDG